VSKHVGVIKYYIIVYVVSAFSGLGERRSTVIQNVTAKFTIHLGDNDSEVIMTAVILKVVVVITEDVESFV
jgi:hypothetical protein